MINPQPEGSQSFDLRLYFDKDKDVEAIRDEVSDALQCHLYDLISAYELVNDGFAHLTPEGGPLA